MAARTKTPEEIQDERHFAKVLADMSPANREFFEDFALIQRNKGCALATCLNQGQAFRHLDRFLGGGKVEHVTRQQCIRFVADLQSKVGVYTAYTYVTHCRTIVRKALKVRELPLELDDALKMKQPDDDFTGRLGQ